MTKFLLLIVNAVLSIDLLMILFDNLKSGIPCVNIPPKELFFSKIAVSFSHN